VENEWAKREQGGLGGEALQTLMRSYEKSHLTRISYYHHWVKVDQIGFLVSVKKRQK